MSGGIPITCPECGHVVDYTGPATAGEQACCRAVVAGLERIAEERRIGGKARWQPVLFDYVLDGLGWLGFVTRERGNAGIERLQKPQEGRST